MPSSSHGSDTRDRTRAPLRRRRLVGGEGPSGYRRGRKEEPGEERYCDGCGRLVAADDRVLIDHNGKPKAARCTTSKQAASTAVALGRAAAKAS